MATVKSLETAQRMVDEAPDIIAAVYEYHHAITGEKLWSVEYWVSQGSTLNSGMVMSPRLIYDGYTMEWSDAGTDSTNPSNPQSSSEAPPGMEGL